MLSAITLSVVMAIVIMLTVFVVSLCEMSLCWMSRRHIPDLIQFFSSLYKCRLFFKTFLSKEELVRILNGAVTFCHLAISSTGHFHNLLLHQLEVFSTCCLVSCCFINFPFIQLVGLSICCFVSMLLYQPSI
jgi:hypothetical protein